MNVFHGVVIHSWLSEKCEIPHSKHVESGHKSSGDRDQPKSEFSVFTGKRLPQNFIFAEESGQKRRSGNGKSSDSHRPECDWNSFSQISHFAEILFPAHCMDYTPGSE